MSQSEITLRIQVSQKLLFGCVTGILIAVAAVFGVKFIRDTRAKAGVAESVRPANLDLVMITDKRCTICFSLDPLIARLKEENVKITSERSVDAMDEEGKKFVEQYAVTATPALLIMGEIEKQAAVKDFLATLGEVKDGTFVLRNVGAPFLETNSGAVRGKAELVEISDKTCATCYDVAAHEPVLANFGLYLENTKKLDTSSAEGRDLVKKYTIQYVPTILLMGDVSVYPSLNQVWPQVGTIEADGTYIFREGVKQMGVYKDRTTGKTVTPTEAVK
ncbi:MAG: hypothetical protein AAB444_00650 [Patescibacteria group bacterium]